MTLYSTIIRAEVNGEINTYQGPNVPGISFAHAKEYCQRNGLGYCIVDGIFTGEHELDSEDKIITDQHHLN